MSYFTLKSDGHEFTVLRKTLEKNPQNLISKVVLRGFDDEKFHQLCSDIWLVDCNPESLREVINVLRGYPTDWDNLEDGVRNKFHIDYQRFGLGQSGGTNENTDETDNSDKEDAGLNIVETFEEFPILEVEEDADEMLPSYSESIDSESSISDDLLDGGSLGSGESDDENDDIQEMLAQGDHFSPERDTLDDIINISAEERARFEEEFQKKKKALSKEPEWSAQESSLDTSILNRQGASQTDIDNLIQSIQENLQGPDALNMMNLISTDPNIIRYLRRRESASENVDTISLSDLMQDTPEDIELDMVYESKPKYRSLE